MQPTNRRWLRSPSERVGTLSNADLPPPDEAPEPAEPLLLRALRDRDEAAFEWLLDRYYSPMLRLARSYVRSREEAEEVVQDAWLAVLAGLDRFEGRSSLKTWIFRILVNRARSRGKREARLTPFSSLRPPPARAGGDEFTPDALLGSDPLIQRWHGRAAVPPPPDERVLGGELRDRIEASIDALPERQRCVITLRDVEGWPPDEVCALLGISEGNQRVLLHRARLKVRADIEAYFDSAEADRKVEAIVC